MENIINIYNDTRPVRNDYLEISDTIRKEWQSILDLIARITGVRAALIMKVQDEEIEVFLASATKNNPYTPGNLEHLKNSGLYCEQVINKRKMLLVKNASKSAEWRCNPDMKYNMKCYLGFPIRLLNGNIFGTICMLDDKENNFSQDIKDFLEKMRDLIESYLSMLYASTTDQLTGLYNRVYLNSALAKEIKNADLHQKNISALLLDVDNFKNINDTFGHLIGDKVLRNLAHIVASSLRNTDMVFRFGGDEFFILMPDTALSDAVRKAKKLSVKIENSQIWTDLKVTTSIGVAERIFGESINQWFTRADKALYRIKRGKHGCRDQVGYGYRL